MFAALGKDPVFWKDRISAFIALAPGLLPETDAIDNIYNNEGELFANFFWKLGIYEFFGKSQNEVSSVVQGIFPNLTNRFEGIYSSKKYNSKNGTQIFSGHFPNGLSLHQNKHFSQLI